MAGETSKPLVDNNSPIVTLRVKSGCEVKIHLSVLQLRGGAIAKAFKQPYQEQNAGYTFSDVTEPTLLRFIEWAYSGDYSHMDDLYDDKAAIRARLSGLDFDSNHYLLRHIRVYVFADTYVIPGLKAIPSKRIRTYITNYPNLSSRGAKMMLLELLDIAFSGISAPDALLNWLGRYVRWAIPDLSGEAGFYDLLPKIGSHVFEGWQPDVDAPWDIPEEDFEPM